MRIVTGEPPIIDLIDAKFHVRGAAVVFAWGDVIYNPRGGDLPPWIVAHEGVHGVRQWAYPQEPIFGMEDPRQAPIFGWWYQYIADPAFRLAEEIPAHQEEWRTFGLTHNRSERLFYLTVVAEKLASPLYGNLISYAAARRVIRDV